MSSIRTRKDQGNDLENFVYQRMLKLDKETTLTSNSGARFSDGDISNRLFRVECKSTSQKSFSLKKGVWDKVQKIADTYSKVGIVVERNGTKDVVVYISFDDFMAILNLAKKEIDKLGEEQ